jgi:catechol 2,3-dioxygenase-like lactoylglutathione lyase family enzyme
VRDATAAADRLTRLFGFRADGGPDRLRLGNQVIALRQDDGGIAGHGRIDHLALAVDDVDAALAAAVARGAVPDSGVTPHGPQFIPEFWTAGTRYVFLQGPEGARIELCSRPETVRAGLPGHDHIGIPCVDLPVMRGFLLSLGCAEIASTTLVRPDGNVPVAFLGLGTSVAELYCPPDGSAAAVAGGGFWRRLLLAGTGQTGQVEGPEGLLIGLRP